MNKLTLAYVTSADNETLNIEELHRRCRLAWQSLAKEIESETDQKLGFRMVIADNQSSHDSPATLRRIITSEPEVIGIANAANYGPEASVVNALPYARDCDLVMLLCSDLQDPPELDAVLAVKKRSAGGPLLRLTRKIYDGALGLSSRRPMVPSGFHGFGCYRQAVLEGATRFWNSTDLNVRQCLTNAFHSPQLIDYGQPERLRGVSLNLGRGYLPEALRSLVSGDAAASRLALTIGITGLGLAMPVGLLLLVNVLRGSSGYGGGVPTVMGLVLISFSVQMLIDAVLSSQIEALRMGGFRRRVLFPRLGDDR